VPRLVLEYIIPVDCPKQLRRWLAAGGGNDEGCEQAGGAAALTITITLTLTLDALPCLSLTLSTTFTLAWSSP
jgi:hypothetical protein